MSVTVAKEYRLLTDKKHKMEIELSSLPVGYISKKTIKGNVQHYLQRREGSRIVGAYIRNEEVDEVTVKIERRKNLIEELALISARLQQLEQAAKLIDKNLHCQLLVYKLSSGMDELSIEAKELCSSFGYAMNAVEGVPVSKETDNAINAWKNGNMSFLAVFENTLKRYGFPVEAR